MIVEDKQYFSPESFGEEFSATERAKRHGDRDVNTI